MVEAARESLKALGVEDRQALIVSHNDEPHPHVHVIVNRVSMEDGRAANMRGDHLRLSRWAEELGAPARQDLVRSTGAE